VQKKRQKKEKEKKKEEEEEGQAQAQGQGQLLQLPRQLGPELSRGLLLGALVQALVPLQWMLMGWRPKRVQLPPCLPHHPQRLPCWECAPLLHHRHHSIGW